MITFKLFILEFFNDNAAPVPTLPPLELSRSLVNFNGSKPPGVNPCPRHNARVTQAVTFITREQRGKQLGIIDSSNTKQCLKIEKMKALFPRKVSSHDMFKRDSDIFDMVKPKTSRYQLSAIPVMQKMLNNAEREKRLVLRKLNSFVPVNYDCPRLYHCDNKTK